MSTLRTTNIKHETSSNNNITLDGSGGVIIAGVTTVSAGSTSAPSITPSGDSNTGIFFPSPDTVAIAEGGVEVLRINSSGNVGIGTTNPSQKLDVDGNINLISSGNYIQKTFADNTEEYILRGPSLSNYYPTISYRRSTGTATRGFIFGTHNNDGGRDDWMSIWNGSVGIGTTNPQAKLHVSGGNIKVDSGYGIDFSATANSSGTMSSELLSDYEEGSWTPAIRGSGNAGTYQLSTAYGAYVKIGRQVTLYANIILAGSITGGGSGYTQITGIPFTKSNGDISSAAVLTSGVDFSAGYTYMMVSPITVGATSTLYFSEHGDNATLNDFLISSIGVGDIFTFTISYLT